MSTINRQAITNGPENVTLNDARSILSKNGSLAKAARFIVRFLPQGNLLQKFSGSGSIMNELSYLCETTELPSRGFMNVDVRHYGPNFKLPFQPQYDDITMTFLCRTEFDERYFFDEWMNEINPVNNFNFKYRDDYSCRIEIYQLAEYAEAPTRLSPGEGGGQNAPVRTLPKPTYKFTLHDSWPTMVSPQPAVWSDDNFQRMAVTFTFSKWTKNDDPLPGSVDSLIIGRPSGRSGNSFNEAE